MLTGKFFKIPLRYFKIYDTIKKLYCLSFLNMPESFTPYYEEPNQTKAVENPDSYELVKKPHLTLVPKTGNEEIEETSGEFPEIYFPILKLITDNPNEEDIPILYPSNKLKDQSPETQELFYTIFKNIFTVLAPIYIDWEKINIENTLEEIIKKAGFIDNKLSCTININRADYHINIENFNPEEYPEICFCIFIYYIPNQKCLFRLCSDKQQNISFLQENNN